MSWAAVALVAFLAACHNSVAGVSLNPNIGSNWNTVRNKEPIKRETPVVESSHPAAYSTLPDAYLQQQQQGASHLNSFNQPSAAENYYNYQVDHAAQVTPEAFNFQPYPQQPQQWADHPNPTGQQFFTSGFDGSNNAIYEQEDNNSLISTLGLDGVWNRMMDMWQTISGGDVFTGMRRVAMGAMAVPLMVPMAVMPIAVGAMALMSMPILQLTLPGIRRSFRDSATFTQGVLRSEQCVERLSCNLARVTRKFHFDPLLSKMEKMENKWLSRVSKSMKAARIGQDCSQFTCSPVSKMQNMVKTYLLQEKSLTLQQEENNDRKTS